MEERGAGTAAALSGWGGPVGYGSAAGTAAAAAAALPGPLIPTLTGHQESRPCKLEQLRPEAPARCGRWVASTSCSARRALLAASRLHAAYYADRGLFARAALLLQRAVVSWLGQCGRRRVRRHCGAAGHGAAQPQAARRHRYVQLSAVWIAKLGSSGRRSLEPSTDQRTLAS